MHNSLIISLSLDPIKYLTELLLPYGSFLETNKLLISMFSNSIYCLIFVKGAFSVFFVIKNYVLSTHFCKYYKKK